MATALLTVGNPKIAKGTALGWYTAVMHFAPFNLSGFQVCKSATAGCASACLNTAGRGGIMVKGATTNMIQEARKRRTREFFANPDAFLERLAAEITRHVAKSHKLGLRPAVRLNGTSDLPWERIRHSEGWTLMARFPALTFYDYTKVTGRTLPPNYSLTFSLAESNDANATAEANAGRNVAVVFAVKKGAALPATYMGRPVVDGDLTDLRFLDPQGVIVGLRAKGKGRQDTTGFVRR